MSSSHTRASAPTPLLRHRRAGVLTRALVAFVLTAVAAVAAPAMAQAATYASEGSFSSGTGTGEGGGQTGQQSTGIAVDQSTGDVYVTNPISGGPGSPGNVAKFGPLGGSATTFGSGTYTGVAFNQATGNVHVVDSSGYFILAGQPAGPDQIVTFTSAGVASTPTIPVAINVAFPPNAPQIATDDAGNIYFPSEASDTVLKFDSTGAAQTFTLSGTTLVDPSSVAIDDAGNLYVVDATGGGRVAKFTTSGTTATYAEDIDTGGSLGLGVNASTGDVFVVTNAGGPFHVVAYNSAGEEQDSFGAGDFTPSDYGTFEPQVAVNESTGRVYVTDPQGSDGGPAGQVQMYIPALPPDANTETPDPIGSTTATLQGIVNPRGLEVTDCHFEYVADAEFTANGWTNAEPIPCDLDPGDGDVDVDVTAAVTGLAAGTTYHVRLVATNVGGETIDADPVDGIEFTTVERHTLTVSKSGAGSGTVTSAPGGISCGSDCTGDFNEGSTVTLTASAAAGSTFTGWSGGGCSGTGPCTVDVGADATVTASFAQTDTDGDGVPDTTDQCDNAGGPASNNGCPPVVTPPPPPPGPNPNLDTDGDGVPDATDQCDTAAGPASNNGCPVTPPAAGKVALAAKTAKYKAGKASVKVKCSGGACKAGKITLKAKIKTGKKRAKTITIGKASVKAMADGSALTVKVKLNGKAKRALARAGKLKAAVSGATKGKVTIKRAR
jgi:Divergent InlB B-repeat domain